MPATPRIHDVEEVSFLVVPEETHSAKRGLTSYRAGSGASVRALAVSDSRWRAVSSITTRAMAFQVRSRTTQARPSRARRRAQVVVADQPVERVREALDVALRRRRGRSRRRRSSRPARARSRRRPPSPSRAPRAASSARPSRSPAAACAGRGRCRSASSRPRPPRAARGRA